MEEQDEYVTEYESFNDVNFNRVYSDVLRDKEGKIYLKMHDNGGTVLLAVDENGAKDLLTQLTRFINKEY